MVRLKHDPPVSKMWALMKWADIESRKNPGQVYLRRLRIVMTPWFAFYIHWIFEADFDRHPHDHPSRFWSYIWRGGYVEKVWDRVGGKPFSQVWARGTSHVMSTTKAHQIVDVWPDTVTFVVTGRRVQDWGFWTEDRKVGHRKYLALADHVQVDPAPEA